MIKIFAIYRSIENFYLEHIKYPCNSISQNNLKNEKIITDSSPKNYVYG
jgi:hypothetical protein